MQCSAVNTETHEWSAEESVCGALSTKWTSLSQPLPEDSGNMVERRDCGRLFKRTRQSGVSGNNPAVLRNSQLLWLPANHLHKGNGNPNMVQGVPIHTLNEELLKVDCYQERKSQFSLSLCPPLG